MENNHINDDSTICVVGIGNEYRRDDGIGIHIARKLKKLNLPNLQVTENIKDAIELIELWKNKKHVIVIDAVSSESDPGMIYRFDVSKKQLPAKYFRHSTHNFSVAEAVELSKKLTNLPARLIIYGVEGKDFSEGVDLSDEIQKVAEYVLDLILQEAKPSLQPLNHSN